MIQIKKYGFIHTYRDFMSRNRINFSDFAIFDHVYKAKLAQEVTTVEGIVLAVDTELNINGDYFIEDHKAMAVLTESTDWNRKGFRHHKISIPNYPDKIQVYWDVPDPAPKPTSIPCPRCGHNAYVSAPQICKDEDLQLECHNCGHDWLT